MRLYGKAVTQGYSRLGQPFVSTPLHQLIVEKCGKERSSLAYNVESEIGILNAAELIYDDFLRVECDFFEGASTIEKLRDRIISHPVSTSSGIDAMVLSYLIDPDISLDELGEYASISENAMTKEFALYFKTNLINERKIKK
jgi:hypothetical protein